MWYLATISMPWDTLRKGYLTPNAACTSPGCANPENVHPRGPVLLPLLFLLLPGADLGHTPPARPDIGHPDMVDIL